MNLLQFHKQNFLNPFTNNWTGLVGTPNGLEISATILNCVDIFSKYRNARVMEDKTAEETVANLIGIFNGSVIIPWILQHDNGSEFIAQVVSMFLSRMSIYDVRTSVRTPTADGVVRLN